MVGLALGAWGDFNEILYSQERSTSVCPSNAMVEFQEFINYSSLLDLLLGGGTLLGPRAEMNRYVQGWTTFFCRQIGGSSF